MSSLVSLVASHGLIKRGQGTPADPDDAVRAAQIALGAAGYRVGQDGVFGAGTFSAVERFQRQHGFTGADVDGKIGVKTAALLDLPHTDLIKLATPIVVTPPGTTTPLPHDDTASLLAYYGKPWEDGSLLTTIPLPFKMTYDEGNGRILDVRQVRFHKKAAARLAAIFAKIWDAYGHDQHALDLTRFTKYSGTYNYRPVRGSSRLSCHAFGAAIDCDAEDLPLGKPNPANGMPANIVTAFKSEGFFWGNDYQGRKDPMHFQAAHE